MVRAMTGRFKCWRTLAAGLALALMAHSQTAAEEPGAQAGPRASPTVVELFTSQGCSSCPPADAYLRELSQRDDIIALSMHVNYWDYIGWRDPFASEATTARQHAYARVLHQRYVYTPEMVVDGMAGEVGSDRDKVALLIARESRRERLRVPVRVTPPAGGVVTVEIPAAEYDRTAAVWLVEYDRERVTHVRRGENAGRKLTNAHVVREIRRIGTWTGDALEISVPVAEMTDESRDGCAVILQAEEAGPILGAAQLSLTGAR